MLPSSLSKKLVFVSDITEMKTLLTEVLMNGEKDVPTFFGGSCNHDLYYPLRGIGSNADHENIGEGVLMFDYSGMLSRLELNKKTMEQKKKGEREESVEDCDAV